MVCLIPNDRNIIFLCLHEKKHRPIQVYVSNIAMVVLNKKINSFYLYWPPTGAHGTLSLCRTQVAGVDSFSCYEVQRIYTPDFDTTAFELLHES